MRIVILFLSAKGVFDVAFEFCFDVDRELEFLHKQCGHVLKPTFSVGHIERPHCSQGIEHFWHRWFGVHRCQKIQTTTHFGQQAAVLPIQAILDCLLECVQVPV